MLKALMKKQFTEMFRNYFIDRKTGKARPAGGTAGFFLLFAFIIGYAGYFFYKLFEAVAGPLVLSGLGWFYYAIAGIAALVVGVFGSVFSTFSGIYHAKDNDLLLSMPIPVSYILTARMTGVYFMGTLYGSVMMIPALIAGVKAGEPAGIGIIFPLILIIMTGFVITGFTCFLGWIIAIVSARLKSKSIITVIFSLIIMGVYYVAVIKANNITAKILSSAGKYSSMIKSSVYPLYAFGTGCTGNIQGFLVFCAFAVVIIAVTVFIMARSFTKIVTAGRGGRKAAYKEKAIKTSGIDKALLRKELDRFLASPSYMLNCGLGIVFEIAASVAIIIKGASLGPALGQYAEYGRLFPVIGAAVVCALTAMTDTAAPSVSLEGKNLWIAQSLPVHPFRILRAKVRLQILLSLIPSELFALAVAYVMRPGTVGALLICLLTAAFSVFAAEFNVTVNLKRPDLEWTSEIVPIKQSLPVMIAIFGSWCIAALMMAAYIPLCSFMPSEVYLAALTVIFIIIDIVLVKHLSTKGAEEFAQL